MADIKVKPTRNKNSAVERKVRVKKLKASNKPSAAEEETTDQEDDIDQQETECLLRLALNIKNACYEQEKDEQENNQETDKIKPIDQLILSEVHNKISDYEKPTLISEDDDDYVIIGCRLSNGVVVCLDNRKTLLRGINDMPSHEQDPCYKNVGFTKIIRSVWKTFLRTHQNWPPLLNGSIFIADNKVL